MKVVINNINIYHIHNNRFYNTGNNSHLNVDLGKPKDSDLKDFASYIVVNDDVETNDNPLIEQLKQRILKSELEVKELLDQLNNEKE